MKTFSTGLAGAYASNSTTLCVCLRVLRADAVVELFTSHDQDVTVGGEVYGAAAGLTVTNLVSQSNASVGNMDLTVLPDEDTYPQVDILAGRWNGAKFWMFECDYTDSGLASGDSVDQLDTDGAYRNDINQLKRGTAGEMGVLRSSDRFELRGLTQYWQQQIGEVTSKTCRARLGDERCTVDLAPFTNDYATTAVASRHVFTCSAATEASDYYGEGTATSLDAENEGYSQKIRSFAGGVFTLSLPMPFTIGVGDTFRVVAGCRKRLDEDCKTKFDNVLNFQGEPHVPGADAITADPIVGGS